MKLIPGTFSIIMLVFVFLSFPLQAEENVLPGTNSYAHQGLHLGMSTPHIEANDSAERKPEHPQTGSRRSRQSVINGRDEIGTLTASSIPLSRATANTPKVEAQRLEARFAQAPSSPGNKLRFHRAAVKRVGMTQDNGLAATFRTRPQPQAFQRSCGTVDKYFFASTGHVREIMRQGWG